MEILESVEQWSILESVVECFTMECCVMEILFSVVECVEECCAMEILCNRDSVEECCAIKKLLRSVV